MEDTNRPSAHSYQKQNTKILFLVSIGLRRTFIKTKTSKVANVTNYHRYGGTFKISINWQNKNVKNNQEFYKITKLGLRRTFIKNKTLKVANVTNHHRSAGTFKISIIWQNKNFKSNQIFYKNYQICTSFDRIDSFKS